MYPKKVSEFDYSDWEKIAFVFGLITELRGVCASFENDLFMLYGESGILPSAIVVMVSMEDLRRNGWVK